MDDRLPATDVRQTPALIMKTLLRGRLWILATASALCFIVNSVAQPVPIPQAHAHNDYAHKRPLLDALDQGFCSVEADIWLLEGHLLVAHDLSAVKPERTLQAMYLDPLRDRVRRNNGRVHRFGPPCTLLVDVKSAAEPTYVTLRELLQGYKDILTEFTPSMTVTNAITIVLSGNRPVELMAKESRRYAAIDGRLSDLQTNTPPHLIPLVSDNWRLHFTWRGIGSLPESEQKKLRQYVALAHQQGRRIRFWNTPDVPAGWHELHLAGVDLINTDDLAGLKELLLQKVP
jgi:hypothetical protein